MFGRDGFSPAQAAGSVRRIALARFSRVMEQSPQFARVLACIRRLWPCSSSHSPTPPITSMSTWPGAVDVPRQGGRSRTAPHARIHCADASRSTSQREDSTPCSGRQTFHPQREGPHRYQEQARDGGIRPRCLRQAGRGIPQARRPTGCRRLQHRYTGSMSRRAGGPDLSMQRAVS